MITKGMGDVLFPEDSSPQQGIETLFGDGSMAIIVSLGLIAGTYLLYSAIGGRKTK